MIEIKTDTKRSFWQFWLLIILLLSLLAFCVYIYVDFKFGACKQSQENPVVYAAKRAEATMCSCLLNNGQTLNFNQQRSWINIINNNSNTNQNITLITIQNLKGGE